MSFLQHVCQRLRRRKRVNIDDTDTDLKRCLTLKRLIFIGVGKTIGVGIYVLIGVATQQAGPGVILSFLIGFLVTLLNALCFAEFASKSPKTGAQYTYIYESIGEGVAFIVGWTRCVGFTAALSLAARGWSGYLDSLFNHRIENFTETHIAHWTRGTPFPEYPDLPAIGIIVVVMFIVSVGVNFASVINTILSTVSVSVLIFIAICGFVYADFDNWFNNSVRFFPNGFPGVLKAAASCYYAYQGFDILGYSVEETVNPSKTIPKSICYVLLIVTGVYLSVAVAFTLMIPLSAINTKAPFPNAFAYHSVTWAEYLVAAGPVLGLANLCMLEMFGIQRLSYSMASDGLLFKFLSGVNKYTKVPVGPVLMFGPIVIILVLVIDLSSLISFMVIFSFLTYTLISAFLIILRYEEGKSNIDKVSQSNNTGVAQLNELADAFVSDEEISKFEIETAKSLKTKKEYTKDSSHWESNAKRGNCKNNQVQETKDIKKGRRCCGSFDGLSSSISVTQLVVLIYILTFFLTLELSCGPANTVITAISLTCLGIPILFATFLIWCRKQKEDRNEFLVPFMPFLPITCLFFNMVMLMSVADRGSTTAAAVMALVGVVIYLVLVSIDYVKTKGSNGMNESYESQQLLSSVDEETEAEFNNLGSAYNLALTITNNTNSVV